MKLYKCLLLVLTCKYICCNFGLKQKSNEECRYEQLHFKITNNRAGIDQGSQTSKERRNRRVDGKRCQKHVEIKNGCVLQEI